MNHFKHHLLDRAPSSPALSCLPSHVHTEPLEPEVGRLGSVPRVPGFASDLGFKTNWDSACVSSLSSGTARRCEDLHLTLFGPQPPSSSIDTHGPVALRTEDTARPAWQGCTSAERCSH